MWPIKLKEMIALDSTQVILTVLHIDLRNAVLQGQIVKIILLIFS